MSWQTLSSKRGKGELESESQRVKTNTWPSLEPQLPPFGDQDCRVPNYLAGNTAALRAAKRFDVATRAGGSGAHAAAAAAAAATTV